MARDVCFHERNDSSTKCSTLSVRQALTSMNHGYFPALIVRPHLGNDPSVIHIAHFDERGLQMRHWIFSCLLF